MAIIAQKSELFLFFFSFVASFCPVSVISRLPRALGCSLEQNLHCSKRKVVS